MNLLAGGLLVSAFPLVSSLGTECVERNDVSYGPLGSKGVPPSLGVSHLSQDAIFSTLVELKKKTILPH